MFSGSGQDMEGNFMDPIKDMHYHISVYEEYVEEQRELGKTAVEITYIFCAFKLFGLDQLIKDFDTAIALKKVKSFFFYFTSLYFF